MKRTKAFLMAALVAASSLAGTSAWADRGYYHGGEHYHRHHDGDRFALGAGLVLGSALLWAATRPPAVAYREPAPVVVPPPVYVAPPPPADGWWYFCRPSETYYPYVPACAVPWERVAPH